MTRLIDADALSKKLCETTIFIKGGEIFQRMINDAPTIEPDGDTISRRAVIGLIKNSYYNLAENMDDVWAMVHDVEQLPSAQGGDANMNEVKSPYMKQGPDDGADLISRQAAILAITGEPPEAHYPSWYADRINALPSVQVEGDLIGRQDAMKQFCNQCKGRDMPCEHRQTCKTMKVLEQLPSAPDSRQRGEWVKSKEHDHMKQCNRCQYEIPNDMAWECDYCPSCGADMRGEEE